MGTFPQEKHRKMQVLFLSRSQKMKLWAIHPFHLGMRVATGTAPPRTATQGWLSPFAISPIHYAPNWAGSPIQLPREATMLGSQKLRVFRPSGVSQWSSSSTPVVSKAHSSICTLTVRWLEKGIVCLLFSSLPLEY